MRIAEGGIYGFLIKCQNRGRYGLKILRANLWLINFEVSIFRQQDFQRLIEQISDEDNDPEDNCYMKNFNHYNKEAG